MRPRPSGSYLWHYVVGFGLPGMAIFVANTPMDAAPFVIANYFYSFVVIPMLTAWAAARLCHGLRKRRAFMPEYAHVFRTIARGLATGIVAMGIIGLASVLTPVNMRLGVLSIAVIVPSVWLSLIERDIPCAGLLCRHCRYNLRGSLAAGRCPECGLEFNALAGMPTPLAVGEAA